MPDASERRQSRRYPLQLPLLHRRRVPEGDGSGIGWTRDLSAEGACVELAERLRSRMPLQLRLRTDQGGLEVEATLAWSGEPALPGGGVLHGVAFTRLAPGQQAALQELLLSKGLVRPAKVRLPFEAAVTCQPAGQAGSQLQGGTQDMSRGGLLLRLPREVPPGTALQIALHTPPAPLAVQGTIVWVAPPEARTPGGPIRHGVRFAGLGWAATQALARLLVDHH